MLDWLKRRQGPPLASMEEREEMLHKLHPVFRQVDRDFHTYLEVITTHPDWDDNPIEKELCRRGVESEFAHHIVAFAPLAFGREILEDLGVKYSEMYRRHDLADGSECGLPLANEMAYVWARAMIALYRTSERNEVFKLIALRSAEVDAVNNALWHGGAMPESLRECNVGPPLVFFGEQHTRSEK